MKNIYEKPVINFWKAEILNEIEASMSGGGGIDTEIGSSRWNPYILTSGKSGTVSLADCWFECEIDGAVDFQITANTEFNVKVYRNNHAPYNLFREWTSQNCKINECVSVHNVNDEINKYMLNVTSSSNITVVCRIKQHVDCVEDDAKKGGIWVPNEDSAHAYASNGIRNAIWYIQKEAVPDLIHLLQSTNADEIFETYEDKMLNIADQNNEEAIGEAIGELETFYPELELISRVSMFLYSMYKFVYGEINNRNLPEEIEISSGYDSVNDRCTAGVVIHKVYVPSAAATYLGRAETWDGIYMYGEPGWTGVFDSMYYRLQP